MKSIQELTLLFNFEVINAVNFFALAVENATVGDAYLNLLKNSANQYHLNDLFVWDPKNLKILITQKDFIQWQRKVISHTYQETKRIPLSKRMFFKCGDGYFTIPLERETVELLKDNLKASTRFREIDIDFQCDLHLGIIKLSPKDYTTFERNSLIKPKRIPWNKRLFKKDDAKQCYYTTPADSETLSQLRIKLRKQLQEKIISASVKIEVRVNEELNRLEISEEVYNLSKRKKVEKPKKLHPHNIIKRHFKFNQTQRIWLLKNTQDETLRSVYNTLMSACKRLHIDKSIFRRHGDHIEISDIDFMIFKNSYLKEKASKYIAYGLCLAKDEINSVYYVESEDNTLMTRSFNSLAKMLDIRATFRNQRARTEIDVSDYEQWIANSIVKESLILVTKPNKESKSKVETHKTSLKPQKAEAMKGGISAKYLEGAFNVPFETNPEKVSEDKKPLLSKGKIIECNLLRKIFCLTDHFKTSAKIAINFHGIKGNITIYKSHKGMIQEEFSNNNVVFVRAGRKENALIPKLKADEKTIIAVLMTRKEYEEMEKSLSFSPATRLPSYVKLCVIESCSLKNQPGNQEQSYLRASNIKRAITYALAEGFNLKRFILMDDNTTQIQMAENVASDASIESLFKLFRQYQSKGTICATLGSFEFYKPITRPLEATEIEDIEERLGSKIMYIDYKRLSQKLKSEKKQLHETVSPCSLWWGEDYFNMLAILKLMENEEQSGLLGVVPYSVAWHKRSHNQQNKAKSTPHFKLANIWLSIDETYLKSLTPHQQQIIRFMQSLVKKAIDEQNARQTKYLATLESQQSNESEKEDQAKPYDLGYHRGVKIATYGCPLDIEKIKHALKSDKSVKPGTEDEYIKGFSEGHQSIWVTLDEASQAYHRGYHDGYLAAKQGFKSDKLKLSNLPATIQEQREYYIEGFKKANLRQWDKMRAATNQDEIQAFAKTMGAALAKTPFAINEAKLWKLSTEFGDNDACFAAAYRAAFNAEKSVKSVPVLPQYNSYKEVATENGVSSTNSADLRAAKIRL